MFAGDARFSNDNPRQEGVIGEHQALVWLPLKSGENEILLALTEIFGGRGLMGGSSPLMALDSFSNARGDQNFARPRLSCRGLTSYRRRVISAQ